MKTFIAAAVLLLCTGFTSPRPQVVVFKGEVVDAASGVKVNGAHIFIVAGETETFTNAQGQFSLRASVELPVNVTVQHKDYDAKTLRLDDAKTLNVQLTHKK